MKRTFIILLAFSLIAISAFSGCNNKENDRKLEDSSVLSTAPVNEKNESTVFEGQSSAEVEYNSENKTDEETEMLKEHDRSDVSANSDLSSQSLSTESKSLSSSASSTHESEIVIPIDFPESQNTSNQIGNNSSQQSIEQESKSSQQSSKQEDKTSNQSSKQESKTSQQSSNLESRTSSQPPKQESSMTDWEKEFAEISLEENETPIIPAI